MLGELLSLFLLCAFVMVNLMVSLWRLFGRLAGVTLRKVLGVELPKNTKKGWERLFTAAWLLVGAWAFFRLWGWSLGRIAAAVFGFLAFRSGANVTRTLLYSLHDRKVVEKHSEDDRLLALIGTATKMSLVLEGVFLFSFALAYKALSVSINSGTSAGRFVLYLWVAGLLFGAAFGLFMGHDNDGILLENAMATVGFFTTKKGKVKGENAVKKTKVLKEKLPRR